MHTEHLQNVRPSWVAFGWFVGAAVTAFLLLALIATGLLDDSSGQANSGWVLVAMFIGFVAAGYLAGGRVGAAPILHAVGIGLFSLVVWFLANLFLGEPLGATTWSTSPTLGVGAVLLQIVAAAIGGRLGSREARAAATE
ncbi:MAG TPA: hypothetical protein VFQ39_12845 [Longimicrobium sp.]|nr:hypothetical protein [Longimicrobium sp.]